MADGRHGVMQSHSRELELATRGIDILLLWVGSTVAHELLGLDWTFKSSVLFIVAFVCFQFFGEVVGLYLPLRSHRIVIFVQRAVLVTAMTFMVLVIAAWASRQPHFISRRMLLTLWCITSGALLVIVRLVIRYFLVRLRKRGYNTRQAAVVGNGELATRLLSKLHENAWMGIVPYGVYADSEVMGMNAPYRGNMDAVVDAARNGEVDYVYITLPMSQEAQIRDIVDALMDTTASIFLIPDIFAFNLLNARQDSIGGLPAISLVDSPLSVAGSIAKRVMDVAASLVILCVIALPMMVIAVVVKRTSPGPVIFKQQRYGMDGKSISVWKFRTMTTQDNGDVVVQATRNDVRLTSVGGFLRRTSLDELPQFFNVLQGHMSIVGPRPHAIAHNELYRKQIKGYMMRHKVKPGITGWAQVNGYRGETDTLEKMQKRIEYDLEYISNWNLWLDIQILFRTVIGGFVGKDVY